MRFTVLKIAVVLLIFRLVCDLRLANAYDISLSCEISTGTILEGDPVLIKTVIRNEGEQDFTLEYALDSSSGALQYEVSRSIEGEYKRVRPKNSGLKSSLYPTTKLRAGESLTLLDVLFIEADRFLFSEVGTFYLRATAQLGKEKKLSNTLTINVVERNPRHKKALNNKIGYLRQAVGSHGPILADDADIKILHDLLDDSELKRVLGVHLELFGAQSAVNVEAQIKARDQIARRKSRSSPVMREYIDLLERDIKRATLPVGQNE
jgi:hypothetical protein